MELTEVQKKLTPKQKSENRLRIYLKKAHELVVKNAEHFGNSLLKNELESLAHRYVNGFEQTKVELQVPISGKRKSIQYNSASFDFPNKKKQATVEVAVTDDELEKLSVEELKVLARNEYQLNTKGVTSKERLIELIKWHLESLKEVEEIQKPVKSDEEE